MSTQLRFEKEITTTMSMATLSKIGQVVCLQILHAGFLVPAMTA